MTLKEKIILVSLILLTSLPRLLVFSNILLVIFQRQCASWDEQPEDVQQGLIKRIQEDIKHSLKKHDMIASMEKSNGLVDPDVGTISELFNTPFSDCEGDDDDGDDNGSE
jgi:hypothetical protein